MTDPAAAHRSFAAGAFNAAWKLIDQKERTLAETREMIRLAETSYFHWLQVPDHTTENLSIGLWQLARVYTLAGESVTALHYAGECLRISAKLPPFHLAYAHEAVARAAALADNPDQANQHLEAAKALLPDIPEESDRTALQSDLSTITS